jgi:hypothetical protein
MFCCANITIYPARPRIFVISAMRSVFSSASRFQGADKKGFWKNDNQFLLWTMDAAEVRL